MIHATPIPDEKVQEILSSADFPISEINALKLTAKVGVKKAQDIIERISERATRRMHADPQNYLIYGNSRHYMTPQERDRIYSFTLGISLLGESEQVLAARRLHLRVNKRRERAGKPALTFHEFVQKSRFKLPAEQVSVI